MPDATVVFPAAFRILDGNGTPVSGAKIRFYDAGTSTPKAVYSNSALSASLGAVVYTNSVGLPVANQGSSTAVVAYVGTAAYKVTITDANDVTILTLDNIKGALDTSTFLTTGSTSTLTQPVVSKTGNYTIVAADRSKLIEANPTGGQFTLTLTAAATLGDNWSIKLRNSGTANTFILAASEAIAFEGGSFTARGFQIGEGCEIICDGTAFKMVGHQAPLLASRGPGIITIADMVGGAPAATSGARYIVSGAFSSYALHDIIEGNGSSFNKYTPTTDCGWLAYVQDEDAYYSFQGSAWVCLLPTQAEAEAGTSNIPFMTPLRVRQSLPARAYVEYADNTSITTVLPQDDTIPQNTEGVEILSVSITLKSASSRVRSRFQGFASGGNGVNTIAALFRGGVANAIQASVLDHSRSGAADTANHPLAILLEYEDAPATAGSVTYSIRVGPGAAGTVRMNGTTSGRYFGGAAKSTLVLEEVF